MILGLELSKKIIKIAITGAAGQIGYSLLFRLACEKIFNENVAIRLQLLELEPAIPALKGIEMELNDCAFPRLESVMTTSNIDEVFKEVDWALLVGSVPRKAGMERKDLLKINGGIFTKQGQAIDQFANENCKVVVVGNPCNTNALIAKANCKRIPQENFFAMTMLDQKRGMCQLAQRAGVHVNQVKNVAIWGNHSATQYPDFYNALINNKKALDVIDDESWFQNNFIASVQKRGAEIIKARGLSSAASAANAIIETVKSLSHPTLKGQYFSVAVSSDGSYGVPKGLMFSYPVQINGQKWKIVSDLEHNAFSKEKLTITLDELLEEKEAIKDLL